MTVPRWDAQEWHKKNTPTPAGKPRLKLAATVAAVALCLGAAAVSATAFGDDEQVGICHATGSEEKPYVFLIVDKNSFEHGHHRHHDDDFFVEPGAGGCDGDVYAAPGNETANETAEPGNTTAPADPSDAPADNGTADGAAPGNETTAPAGNETAEEPAGNETANETAEATDAWVRQTSQQHGDEVVLVLVVGNQGTGAAGVQLLDSLPDVKRTWYLGGADAGSCVLDERELSCWFAGLAPGETRQVELQSYTDRMPCGFSLTNTANVVAEDDVEARNDASSASILARAC